MGLDAILDRFSPKYSIDLGTANTLIYDTRVGEIVLNEPSIVAVSNNVVNPKDMVCVVGNEAKRMVGKTPGRIKTVRPLRDGVIADFHLTEKMLQHFIQTVHTPSFLRVKPKVICVPCGSTQVERRAIKESAYGAGARHVKCVDEPLAAAIGAGMKVDEPNGNMIIDIGGGTTEIAIISLNGVVYAQSVRIGGDTFDEAIISYIKRNFGCLIGEATAERVKMEIGTAFPLSEVLEMQISGRHIAEGVPRSMLITSNEILEALHEPLSAIITAIRVALEQIPPELAADIDRRGMMLSGGGALLRQIDRLISEEVSLPVYVAEDPKTCVVRGGGMILENYTKIQQELVTEE